MATTRYLNTLLGRLVILFHPTLKKSHPLGCNAYDGERLRTTSPTIAFSCITIGYTMFYAFTSALSWECFYMWVVFCLIIINDRLTSESTRFSSSFFTCPECSILFVYLAAVVRSCLYILLTSLRTGSLLCYIHADWPFVGLGIKVRGHPFHMVEVSSFLNITPGLCVFCTYLYCWTIYIAPEHIMDFLSILYYSIIM